MDGSSLTHIGAHTSHLPTYLPTYLPLQTKAGFAQGMENLLLLAEDAFVNKVRQPLPPTHPPTDQIPTTDFSFTHPITHPPTHPNT